MFKFDNTPAICEAGVWVHIKNGGRPAYWPDADGKDDKSRPVRIKVMGDDSPTLQERSARRAAAHIKAAGGVSVDFTKMTEFEIVERLAASAGATAEKWADAALDWENWPGPDGEPIEFSAEAAEASLKANPAITRQLQAEVGPIDDFLAAAKRASAN